MNIPILQWPVVSLSGSSLQAMERTTSPSFSLSSSTDLLADTSLSPTFFQKRIFQISASLDANDAVWGSAGPYDDDGEVEQEEDRP
jgi:hypothetical protein